MLIKLGKEKEMGKLLMKNKEEIKSNENEAEKIGKRERDGKAVKED